MGSKWVMTVWFEADEREAVDALVQVVVDIAPYIVDNVEYDVELEPPITYLPVWKP